MVNWNETKDMDSLEFISLRQQMKESEAASFIFDAVRWTDNAGANSDGEVITLINTEDSTAAAVWVTPYPGSQFEVDPEQTDGARLGRAFARACDGDLSKQDVIDLANEKGGSLTVRKNDYGDSWAWLWEVKLND